MTRLIKVLWLFLALALLGLAACNLGASASPTPERDVLYTQIWLTAEAAQTETAAAAPPTETPTNMPENSPTLEPSNTPLISDTPEPGVPSATSAVVSTRPPSQDPCDTAEFVEDVSYPDGSEITLGTSYIIKTWRFKNTGPCQWDRDYHLVYGWQSGGTKWNELAPVPFEKIVLPGETFDITVQLIIPQKVGEYAAWFRLQNDQGFNFGDPFAVYIKVVEP